ncbi:MAG: sodium/proton-translocating pyrophosphatase [Asgard group archaeon]|nr:sodium/proton-translocating pyrophosphatase [Asgard group archaeon]
MYQEEQRTYRTALEEELKWNLNFLKIVIIILLVSSCSLLLYLVMHSIYVRSPGIYTIYYSDEISYFFFSIFGVVALYLVTPLIFMLFIVFIRMTRIFPREDKKILLAAAILQLSAFGTNIIFAITRSIYAVSTVSPMSYEGYIRMQNAHIISSFFIDYLSIVIAMILLSIVLVKQKRNAGYTGNKLITPLVASPLLAIWLIFVIIYYIVYKDIGGGKIVKSVSVLACLTSAVIIAMYTEILLNLRKINIPQIIAMREKLT